MIEQLLEQAKHQWLNIGSVIFLLILIPIRMWTRDIALQKIKKKFDKNEYIVYEFGFRFNAEFFAPFLFGGITLELILSHDLPQIHLVISIACILILFFIIFLTSCSKYVITNKRFFCAPSFDFMYKFNKFIKFLCIKFFELNISDISSVTVKKSTIGILSLEINTKTCEKLPRLYFDNMDEIQSKINSQILLLNN